MVEEALDSAAALRFAGMDWNVAQKDIMTVDGSTAIPELKANMRDTDGSVFGIVTDRYTMDDETGEGRRPGHGLSPAFYHSISVKI